MRKEQETFECLPPIQPTDPTISDQELIVTSYVYNRFGGDTYDFYDYGGARYWTFGDAPHERWVDTDLDGYWDYGRRDEGNGHWSTFDGFVWRDANGEVVGDGMRSGAADMSWNQNDLTMASITDTTDNGWFL